MTSYLLLKLEHTKPIPDLTDIAAGRVYTLDRVNDVTASLIDERQAKMLEATLKKWGEQTQRISLIRRVINKHRDVLKALGDR